MTEHLNCFLCMKGILNLTDQSPTDRFQTEKNIKFCTYLYWISKCTVCFNTFIFVSLNFWEHNLFSHNCVIGFLRAQFVLTHWRHRISETTICFNTFPSLGFRKHTLFLTHLHHWNSGSTICFNTFTSLDL